MYKAYYVYMRLLKFPSHSIVVWTYHMKCRALIRVTVVVQIQLFPSTWAKCENTWCVVIEEYHAQSIPAIPGFAGPQILVSLAETFKLLCCPMDDNI